MEIEEPIRISRNQPIVDQVIQELQFDEFMDLGLYEKTIDPETREPIYLPL